MASSAARPTSTRRPSTRTPFRLSPTGPPQEGYHFTEDMTDRSIEWIRQQKALMPDKPFFVYYAPGATHAPHHVPAEWSAKYKGKFDDGWDAQRERTFARQKELGVIPQDAELTARPPEIPAWDEMPDDLKPVLARQMEVYAGFMEHTDHHVGRLHRRPAGDAAARRHARLRDHRRQRRVGRGHSPGLLQRADRAQRRRRLETTEFMASTHRRLRHATGIQPLRRGLGARDGHAVPVDQAGRQPLGRYTQRHDRPLAQWHQGQGRAAQPVPPRDRRDADRPRGRRASPRRQFVNGIQQAPLEGTSMLYAFDDAAAADTHTTQYFEMFVNRGIYHKGWTAVTRHSTPWVMAALATNRRRRVGALRPGRLDPGPRPGQGAAREAGPPAAAVPDRGGQVQRAAARRSAGRALQPRPGRTPAADPWQYPDPVRRHGSPDRELGCRHEEQVVRDHRSRSIVPKGRRSRHDHCAGRRVRRHVACT